MPDLVEQRLNSLRELDKSGLHKLWKEFFERLPPPRLRTDVMTAILAYRIQEQASEGMGAESKRKLAALAHTLARNPKTALQKLPSIKPGTRLVRQWRNRVYVVEVEQNGFSYNGTRYQTLSEIARQITGTHWSGPLFFGTKARSASNHLEAK